MESARGHSFLEKNGLSHLRSESFDVSHRINGTAYQRADEDIGPYGGVEDTGTGVVREMGEGNGSPRALWALAMTG